MSQDKLLPFPAAVPSPGGLQAVPTGPRCATGPRMALKASAMAGALQAEPCSLPIPGWADRGVRGAAGLYQGREVAVPRSFPRAGRQ